MQNILPFQGVVNLCEEKMKEKRSLELIASFANGYINGWYFAVGECFKDALDIKLTERREPFIIDGIRQYEITEKNSVKKKKPLSKTVMRWTQGMCYSFAEGHILYDTPKAYLEWKDALKYINMACFIVRATPSGINGDGLFTNGSVTFKLAKPNDARDELRIIGQYHLNQKEFVQFLKDGKIDLTMEQGSNQ